MIKEKKIKWFIISVVSAVVFLLHLNAVSAYCIGCGPGIYENQCPTVGQQIYFSSYYYDKYSFATSSYSCTQYFCTPYLECNRNGPIDRVCHNLLCDHLIGNDCPDPADCETVNPICAYSYSVHYGRSWGWWVPGDIPQEAGLGTTTSGNIECRDKHDNDCDGTCDDVGCCSNSTFANPATCTANGRYFCHAPAYNEFDCIDLGASNHKWEYVNGYEVCHFTGYLGSPQEPVWCNLMSGYSWDLAPNQWLPPDNDCSPQGDKLKFVDSSSGTVVAAIGSNGVMHIKGNLYDYYWPFPVSGDNFVIRDNSGNPVVMLERETGDLFIIGELKGDLHNGISATSGSDFIVKDSSGNIVAMFDELGNLHLRGAFLDKVSVIN